MTLSKPAAATAATLFTLFIAASSGLSIWAALEDGENRGVNVLHAANGKVYVAVDRHVWICGEDGACPGRLVGADGSPFRFDIVMGMTSAPSGEVYVSDPPRKTVELFDAQGRFVRTIRLSPEPSVLYEVMPVGDLLVVADNVDHRLRLTSPDGKAIKSVIVKYPNGISRLGDGLVVTETGQARLKAFDASLEETPNAIAVVSEKIVALRRDPANSELIEMAVGPDGQPVYGLCRTTSGDCRYFRGDAVIGDLDSLPVDRPDLVGRDLLTSDVTVMSEGTVLVASPRLTGIFALAESGPRPFGDAALMAELARLRAIRPRMDRVEAIGRWATLLSSALLVGLLVFARQTGVFSAERAQQRVEAIWKRVVRPDLRAYLALLGTTVAVGGSAAAVPFGFSGTGTAIAVFIAAAFLSARWLGVKLFVARRSEASAREAFALQLGVESAKPVPMREGETLTWSAVGRLRDGSIPDDLFGAADAAEDRDLLEALLPPLVSVTRTSERLLIARTSIFGSPLDDVAAVELAPGALATVPGRLAVKAGRMRLRLSGGSGVERVEAPVTWLNRGHGSAALAVPLLLSLVFPGLGQLAQSRFGPARTLLLGGIAASADALPLMIPQWTGRLPFLPWQWAFPLTAYFVLAVGAVFDVIAHAQVRRARRA